MPRKESNPVRIGDRFGKLIVRDFSERKIHFLCVCDCGNTKDVRRDHLKAGNVVSCGCFRNESSSKRAHVMHKANKTHGVSNTPLHGVWFAIKQRCLNPNNAAFKYYGGRGIKICDRWMDFSNFLADLGQPEPNMTIDRINTDGDYEPNNCRWATRREQMLNTRKNRLLFHDGKNQTIQEWSEEKGIKRTTLESRLQSGWSVKDALEIPLVKRGYKH